MAIILRCSIFSLALLAAACRESASTPATETAETPLPSTAAPPQLQSPTTTTVSPTAQRPSPLSPGGTVDEAIVDLAAAWTGLEAGAFDIVSIETINVDDSCLGAPAPWLTCVAPPTTADRAVVRAAGFLLYEFRLERGRAAAVWVPGQVIEGRVEQLFEGGLLRLSGRGEAFADTIEPGFIEGQIAPGTVIPDSSALDEGTWVTAGIVGKPDSDVAFFVGIVPGGPAPPR